jgi:HK97 family phage portal protein
MLIETLFQSRSLENPSTPLSDPAAWLYEAFGAVGTDSGMSVSPTSSLRCTAVYGCVSVLAQSIAQVPWDVYKREGKTRTVARDRIEHWLLHNEPSALMTSYAFRVAIMANALLGGNLYAEILRDGAARTRAFRILPSGYVSVYPSLNEESLVYKVTRKNGNIDTLDGSDVIHVPCIALDGVAGLSPISQNRQAIGLALAAEAAGASFFGNGSRPSGYLSLETALKPDQREELEKKWNAAYGGVKNTGKVPVLSGGLKWQQLAISPSDAQYIESREFQIADIARIFRVPAVLIGLADKSATYASAEQFFLAFVKFTLSPWIQAIEQEFNRKLFPGRDDFYCKLDMNGLLRGDAKARGALYKDLFAAAALSPNDIRDWEDLDPVTGGDRYFIQQGFMPIDKADEVIAAQIKSGQKPPAPAQQQNDGNDNSTRDMHVAWLQDVVNRVSKWEKKDSARIAEAMVPVFRSLGAQLGLIGDADGYCAKLAEKFEPSEQFAARSIDGLIQEFNR